MHKINKQKILAIFLIIALFAAVVNAFATLYNSIEFLCYTPYYDYKIVNGETVYTLAEEFEALQKPLAVISLVGVVFAICGIIAGISAFFAKKPTKKVFAFVVGIAVTVLFLVLIIATVCKWKEYYNDNYDYHRDELPGIISSFDAEEFILYSGIVAQLIQQLIYFAIITVTLIASFAIERKTEKLAAAEQPAA